MNPPQEDHPMSGILSLADLETAATSGQIDTVVACFPDMQGRLMGKRFHIRHFLDSAWRETHCCDYLLATDLDMNTVEGYAASSWRRGYGDYTMRPDLGTLRVIPWLDATALVLCDVLDHHAEHPVAHAPRNVLKAQIERLAKLGLQAMTATELEFFHFSASYETLNAEGFRNLQPVSAYNQDYHIFQTTKEEGLMRRIRNGLFGAGIPIENSKGEAETGQEELNVRYAPALLAADHHTIAKQACKEIAWSQGRSVTFMAKWHENKVGSSSHVHMSLADLHGRPVGLDPDAPWGMSATMAQFVAGQIAHAPEYLYFLAPYINSYKRFRSGTFAPTTSVWSPDNRTAGFRLCGEGTPAIRMECRLGGADLNPYLAIAALIAAGIHGIERGTELGPPFAGDAYSGVAPALPRNLEHAATLLDTSTMLRQAMGDALVDHYARAARWEIEEHERVVTDWEIRRGFEQC
jgi:glutamine synthetase